IFPVYNGKPVTNEPKEIDLSEKSFLKELNVIKRSLSEFYTEVETLAIYRDVQRSINNINKFNPDVIYNFVESVEGIASYEWCMAGLFELLGFEYTGCNPASLGNCLNKARAKNILTSRGIKTPRHITLKPYARFTKKDIEINYPAIIKLLSEDASIGISEYSVVNNYTELRKQFNFLTETYRQDVIIEEYIAGRELNVAVLGDKVLPISEIDFEGLPEELPSIVTYDGKWIEGSVYYKHTKPVCPVKLNERIKNKIIKIAIDAFEALSCRDYSRIDVRLDKKNVPYIIEVNPNPDISTDSGFARAAAAAGISHKELLNTIANFALSRKKVNDTQVKAG
ncbi:MAG: ATP-grasp domain-containing protein, partial [Ignavibacteria bacterium]|nr:ATP-grasp domain-containing protein [Ignavibacteria bacterium]